MKTKMETIGILGLGEVGSAIQKLAKKYFRVLVRDLNVDTMTGEKIEILNICIPYSGKFEQIVVNLIKEMKPKLVVIHATVKPGTTRNIYKRTKVPVAHTPIMGVHPYLAKYQLVFAKMVGAVNDESFRLTKNYWTKLGAPKVVKFDRPEETEWGKILSTTYYGWNIMFNKMVKDLTTKTKTNFDQVYTKFNQIYNQGYAKTKPNVRRPILNFVEGKIGGHCVIPNAVMMMGEKEAIFDRLVAFNDQIDDKKKR